MTVEQDIAELKTDVKWIKDTIREMKNQRQMNKGYVVGLIGATIIAIASLAVAILR